MSYEKQDIILIDFPFSDLTQAKKRPALIVKNLEGNNNIVCQITTKRRNIAKHEVSLNKSACEGDIRFDSKIYIDMIFTLHKGLIYRKLGFVKDNAVIEEINKKLRILFFD